MKIVKSHLVKIFFIPILVLAMFAISNSASAAINPLIKFEGKVTNTDGTELADNTYDFVFSLYTQASGGSAIWTEALNASTRFSADITGSVVNASSTTFSFATSTASATSTLRAGQYLTNSTVGESALIVDFDATAGTIEVIGISFSWNNADAINNRPYVEGGVIDQNLGTVSDLTTVDFNQPLYLQVVFNGETMQPRKLIAATAHAFESAKLGGKSESEFAALNEDETVTGEWSFENILRIATSSASTALTVTQTGAGNLVEFIRGVNNAFAILGDGRVQIGSAGTGYFLPSTRSATAGYVLKTDGSGNLSWQVDWAGSGGGSGLWATSTDGLLVFQANAGMPVLLGDIATSSPYNNVHFEVDGYSWFDDIGISEAQELRFFDLDSSNYFGFKSPNALGSDFVLTLPNAYGSAGDALLTDASGNLYWGAPTSFVYVNSGLVGQVPYYASSGDALSATSSIFITSSGKIAIGTTTASTTLTVGPIAGSQLLINSTGEIVEGVWKGSPVGVAYGGTGTSTFSQYSIPYLSNATTFGEISIGDANYILSVNDSGTGYEWIQASSSAAYRSDEDIQDLVGAMTGTTTRIVINYDDANGKITYAVNGDLSVYDNSVSQFFSTTTLGALPVNWGGTGRTTNFTQNSILFATTSTEVGELITLGHVGEILQVGSDGTPFWAATTSLGFDLSAIAGNLAPDQGGTGQDSSAWNGMVQVVGGVWQEVNGTAGEVAYWVDANTVGSEAYLSAVRGGLGANFSASTGFVYFDGGVAIASSTISIAYTDLTDDGSGVVLNGNVLSLDVTGDWTGTLDGLNGSDLFRLTAWYATTTDALDEGSINQYWTQARFDTAFIGKDTDDLSEGLVNQYWTLGRFNTALLGTTSDALDEGLINLYWTQARFDTAFTSKDTDDLNEGLSNLYWSDSRFDSRLSATTSLPNILQLSGLEVVGVIATGTWQADVINVAFGGTGLTNISNQSLLVGGAGNTINELVMGGEGEALVVQGGTLTWSTTTAPAQHGILSVSHTNVKATSTLERGDLMMVDSDGDWTRLELGQSGYILYSNGNDAVWASTSLITSVGTIVSGIWNADPIDILYGGTGATTATGARENLDLDEVYKFGVNATGTNGEIWQSDGDGRGRWVGTSTLGIGGGGYAIFTGTTTATTDGTIASSSLVGYEAANFMCNFEFPGSHFCHTYEMVTSIDKGDITTWGNDTTSAWITEGPPGYTTNANDCNGWTNNSGSDTYGAFWLFNNNGGGAAWLVNCSVTRPLACCSWQ